MSYELRADETLGDGIRRILCRQIENAINASETKQNGKGSPVHETRKHLKKARAALRLVRGEIDCDVWKREDRCLGKVGQLISEVRDAEVRLGTVRQLREFAHGKKRSFKETEELLAFELESFLAAFSEWPKEVEKRLAAGQAELQTAARKRPANLQARSPGAEACDQENECRKSAFISEAGKRTLVSTAAVAAAGAGCVQGVERRIENHRGISRAGP
jgi:hypothetical protein